MQIRTVLFAITLMTSNLVCAGIVLASETEPSLYSALQAGKPSFSLRWRFEHVEDDFSRNGARLKDANASTVRATLGYETARYQGLAAYLQFEAVGALGIDDYHDGSGVSNGRFATIVDPEGIEVNQGYVSWRPNAQIDIKAGRQIITYRDAPFHRFIGSVLWRQNWQTQDAVSVAYTASDKLKLNYAYIWNVNRIFGEDAPEPLSYFDSNSHLINLQYSGIEHLRLEAYVYLLDFDNAKRFSSNTFGIRAGGAYPLNELWTLVYDMEYAHQGEASGNRFDYGEDYILAEGGIRFALNSFVKLVTLKLSYELLGGSGKPNGAFVTVLGTNHAFQGWADRFLITPNDGIEDQYLTAIVSMEHAMKFIVSYHELNSNNGDFDYGDEVDLMLSKSFLKHYNVGIKASFYEANVNPRNASGATSTDVTKFWLWAGVNF